MKTRIAAFAAVTLATLALMGCGKAPPTANNSNSTVDANTSPSATPTATVSSTGSTPTETFVAYYNAVKAKNVAAAKALLSRTILDGMEKEAAARNTTVDSIMSEGMEQGSKDVPEKVPEVRNERIEGDRASIEIKDAKADQWDTIRLVKEDGGWKLAFDK